jgi:hypothetical protein
LQTCQSAGIWLDYLTYAGWFEVPDPDLQESCFCLGCIADFCESTGIDADTPTVILEKYQTSWTQHKCERIAKFAAIYANLIKSHLPECIVGAYMCPWTPEEFDGALTRFFTQDYEKMAPAIDVFTPLIYQKKSGRFSHWGHEFLERSPDFVPSEKPVQLILDALDFPESLLETARSPIPSWGLQMLNGVQIFSDPTKSGVFKHAVTQIQNRVSSNRLL